MYRVCLDTSAYSHFRRGDPIVVELVTAARQVLLPTVVLGELRVGFALGSQRAKNEQALKEFMSQEVVTVMDVTEETSAFYADVLVALRRAGTPIPSNDIWIAALAIQHSATLLSYDEDFKCVQRLSLQWLETS